jgi:hypothetical protein
MHERKLNTYITKSLLSDIIAGTGFISDVDSLLIHTHTHDAAASTFIYTSGVHVTVTQNSTRIQNTQREYPMRDVMPS